MPDRSPPPPSAWPRPSASVTATAVEAATSTAGRAIAQPSAIRDSPASTGPAQMRRRLDQLIETNRATGTPSRLAVFDAPGPAPATAPAGGGRRRCWPRRRRAARQHPPRRRGLPARGGRALRAGAEPDHGRRGADGRAAAGQLDELEAGGGPANHGLGRSRRLPRARRRRRAAAAQGRRGDVAGARGRAAGRRRRICKIADRFAEICP